jgi:hypothetical protein
MKFADKSGCADKGQKSSDKSKICSDKEMKFTDKSGCADKG